MFPQARFGIDCGTTELSCIHMLTSSAAAGSLLISTAAMVSANDTASSTICFSRREFTYGGWSKGWNIMNSVLFVDSAYLFLEGDLREIVDGTIMGCVELARKVAKIATILEETYDVNLRKRERKRERERERERIGSQGTVSLVHTAGPTGYR